MCIFSTRLVEAKSRLLRKFNDKHGSGAAAPRSRTTWANRIVVFIAFKLYFSSFSHRVWSKQNEDCCGTSMISRGLGAAAPRRGVIFWANKIVTSIAFTLYFSSFFSSRLVEANSRLLWNFNKKPDDLSKWNSDWVTKNHSDERLSGQKTTRT